MNKNRGKSARALTARRTLLLPSLPALCLVVASCTDDAPGPDVGVGSGGDGTGGSSISGGTTGAGGAPTSGGGSNSGGTNAGSGGDTIVSSGGDGSIGSGGSSNTGGDNGSGGNTGEPEVHVYLALGQSNMEGAAFLPDEPISHPRVTVLQDQNCPEHDFPYGTWREQFQPMIRCRIEVDNAPIGLGPADTFAVTMAEAAGPNVTIAIVGAAYGGSKIEAHLPNCGSDCKPPYGDVSGAPVVNGTTPLYRWMIDLATKAQEIGEIKGIIFHQGESNSGQQSWLGNVETYVTSLRNDLGLDPAKVPFIAGELPRTGCCAGHNALVQQIPDYVENGHWVSSGPMEDGTVLGDRGDGLHWSTFSVIEMGKRYAAKMLEVQ